MSHFLQSAPLIISGKKWRDVVQYLTSISTTKINYPLLQYKNDC